VDDSESDPAKIDDVNIEISDQIQSIGNLPDLVAPGRIQSLEDLDRIHNNNEVDLYHPEELQDS
jgi:hypothetical protein